MIKIAALFLCMDCRGYLNKLVSKCLRLYKDLKNQEEKQGNQSSYIEQISDILAAD